MKHIVTTIALLAMAALYIMELNFHRLSTANWIGLGILFLMLVYYIIYITQFFLRLREKQEYRRFRKEQQRLQRQEKKEAGETS